MFIKLKFLIGLLVLGVFVACDSDKPKKDADIKNDSAAKNLAQKYNARIDWDTSNYYSATLQEIFIEKNKLMVFKGRIYDIIKIDSDYVIKILDDKQDLPRNYIAIVACSREQYENIFDSDPAIEGSFVIKISKITSSNPSIKTEEGRNGEDTYTYTELSDEKDEMISMFNGKLIDYHLNEINK